LSFESIIYLILGGSFGVLCRLFILRKGSNIFGLRLEKFLVVNLISSLLVGIYMALNISSYRICLMFSVGFLGCFSTFSSFIFHLFTLIKEQRYHQFFKYYINALICSFLLFVMGYFITKVIIY